MASDTPLAPVFSQRGIVFFAHGSRDPLWCAPIEAVAQTLRQQYPQTLSACAYLEISKPDLATACQGLIDQGCTHITVLPMFLGTGRHARHDLPILVQALRSIHGNVQFHVATTVGEDSRVTQALADIAHEYIL